MAIDGNNLSAIEMCTYLTSEIRAPLYFVLRAHNPAPNGHIANELYNTVKAMRLLALANQFHVDHHEDSLFTTSKHQILRFLSLSGLF